MRAPRHFRRAGRRMEGAAGLWALGVLLGLLVVGGGSAAEGSDLPERCFPPTFGIGLTVRTEAVNFFGSESDQRHGPSTFRFFPGDEIRVRLRLEHGDGLAPPQDSGFEEILARADLCLVRGHEGPPLLMFVQGGALDQFLARSAALREAWFAEHFVPSDSEIQPVQRPCRDRGCWGWVDVLGLPAG